MNLIVVDGDQARLYGTPKTIPQGQSQFSQVQFSFSEEWTNLRKVAQFEQKGNIYNVEVSDDRCFCPSELVKGGVNVRVKGYPGDTTSAVIATANEIVLFVSVGFQSGGIPSVPPTPDLYQKLIGEFSDKVQPDWSQNDSVAKDYVKNRTHWVDNDGKVHKLDKKFLPDSSAVSFSAQTLTDNQKAQARENISAQEWICGEQIVEISAGYGYRGFINSAGYGLNSIYKARIGKTYFKNIQCNDPGNIHPEYTLGAYTITLNFNAESMDVTPSDISSSEIEFFKQETQVTKIPSKYVPKDSIFVQFYKDFTGKVICEKTYDELRSLVDGNRYIVVLYSGDERYWLERTATTAGIRFFCPNGRVVTIGSDGNNTWNLGYFATESYVKSVALPPVTTDDNGKTLKVVDGAWAAVTIANANGVSF